MDLKSQRHHIISAWMPLVSILGELILHYWIKTILLLDNPRNYRDPRTNGFPEKAFEEVSQSDIRTDWYSVFKHQTYQLLSMRGSASLESANTLLMMADLFNFYFTGSKTTEFSNATTTQMFNPITRTWAYDLLTIPTSNIYFTRYS